VDADHCRQVKDCALAAARGTLQCHQWVDEAIARIHDRTVERQCVRREASCDVSQGESSSRGSFLSINSPSVTPDSQHLPIPGSRLGTEKLRVVAAFQMLGGHRIHDTLH